MKPSARISSAIDLLSRIQSASRIPMDAVIRDFMAQRRFIGSKDRTAIVERIYRIKRAEARLGWWIAQAAAADTARMRVIADLCLEDRFTSQDAASVFGGGKYDAPELSGEELAFADFLQGKTLNAPDMPPAVRCECPPWAEEKLRSLFGDAFEPELSAMIVPAPLDLRVNTVKGTVKEAEASLRKDGVCVSRTPYSSVGLRAEGKPFMSDTKAFQKGLVEIQDEGSQLIGLLCAAAPGMRVLDYCAGGGGKTLVLAALMENRGNIVAMDNDSKRLEKGRLRYRKAGIHNVELRSLEEEQNRKWLRRQKGTMDVVLIDAPCSSSGTWRRNPDIRWKFYGPSLEEIMASQADIMDRVADKVKPGGRLVYATCSLFPEENERQVEGFLSRHPGYAVVPVGDILPDYPDGGPYMRLTPLKNGTDGFFAAVLKKL